jgi:hypothetical protein
MSDQVVKWDVRWCKACESQSFHQTKSVMVYSPGGAQRMLMWSCEKHPLDDVMTVHETEAT